MSRRRSGAGELGDSVRMPCVAAVVVRVAWCPSAPFQHRLSCLDSRGKTLRLARNGVSRNRLELKLNHDGHIDEGFVFAQVGEPDAAGSATTGRFGAR